MKEFERALKYYDIERRKGVAGPIYTAFRKLGANADNFGAWLNLLPAGDYGTPICGMSLSIWNVVRLDSLGSLVEKII